MEGIKSSEVFFDGRQNRLELKIDSRAEKREYELQMLFVGRVFTERDTRYNLALSS